ncbi:MULTISPECIES: nucleotide-binding protein [Acidiphilium]|uniref:Flagellar biosynthesis protein FlhG n=1 Tax=Acidiphilium rubrum TaxID=526 RepID=A0A8G2FEY9_ACIRU|nr:MULTISPECIES: AAA family ATPase [Acidiphilium]SIR19123.1 flagellar biosynthesis protein FlhG [Acidiphilium rubrum]
MPHELDDAIGDCMVMPSAAALFGPSPVRGTTPRLIALASGKGGVGKTWLSLTLAQALSGRRRRVLVFDADFGLANADIQLGHLAGLDLAAIMRDGTDLREGITKVAQGGFDLIAGQAGSGALAGVSIEQIAALLDRLTALASDYDVILFDLGTGVEPVTRHVAAYADTVILVTTEDPSSLTDAYAVLKLLKRDRLAMGRPVDARIVVNQTQSEPAGKRAHAALARAARGFLRLDPPLLGTIGRDERVAEAIRSQRLLLSQFPQSAAAGSVMAIARRLLAR